MLNWKLVSTCLGLIILLLAIFGSLKNSHVHMGVVNIDSSTKTITATGTEDEYSAVHTGISFLILLALCCIIHIIKPDFWSDIGAITERAPSDSPVVGVAGVVGGSSDQQTSQRTVSGDERPSPHVNVGPIYNLRPQEETTLVNATGSEAIGGSYAIGVDRSRDLPMTRSLSTGNLEATNRGTLPKSDLAAVDVVAKAAHVKQQSSRALRRTYLLVLIKDKNPQKHRNMRSPTNIQKCTGHSGSTADKN